MPRNGSGVYSLPSSVNPVVTQTLITSNWANTTLNDVALAITNSIARDGQSTPTANLPMGGFKFTNVGEPTARNEFATLGFVQDGRHLRLTNLGGNANAITATLVGGQTSFVTGQIIQIIPNADNTGPVTLSINGSAPVSVLTAAGNALSFGNLLEGKPYLLTWDGTRWQMVATPDASSFAQSAMSGWDRPVAAGGAYPDITIINATTVAIPAGTGRLIAPSARDISGVREVQWAAQNVPLTNIANAWATTLAIDGNGNVVQFVGNVQASWARTNVILGTVVHVNGSVNSVVTRPAIFGDMSYASYDLSVVFNNMLISGGQMRVSGSNPLHLDIEAGKYWVIGGQPDQTDAPNVYSFNDQINIQFFTVTGNNTVGGPVSAVPVTQYDPGGAGTATSIPGTTTAVIHRMYMLVDRFMFVYGQNTYADLDTALGLIGVDSSDYVPPSRLSDATLIGYIVAQKDCTDLGDTSTCRLVNAGGSTFNIGSAGSIPDAPQDGKTYGRKNAGWVTAVDQLQAGQNISIDNTNVNKPVVSMPSGTLSAGRGIVISGTTGTNRLVQTGTLVLTGTEGFRNKIINGNFDVWQRGTTLLLNSQNAYLADRWYTYAVGSSIAVNRSLFVAGQTNVPNGPAFFHDISINTAGSGIGDYTLFGQIIERLETLAGQTVTVSFWAKSNATRQISIEMGQNFGAGGTPSATINGLGVTKFTIGTSWQKFTAQVAIPSIAGKSLGLDGNDGTYLNFWLDAGSAYNSRTDTLGHQTGQFHVAQVQVEIGSVATPFEIRPLTIEETLGYRYTFVLQDVVNPFAIYGIGYAASATQANILVPVPATMRTLDNINQQATSVTFDAPFNVTVNGTTLGVATMVAQAYKSYVILTPTLASGSMPVGAACMLTAAGTTGRRIVISRELV